MHFQRMGGSIYFGPKAAPGACQITHESAYSLKTNCRIEQPPLPTAGRRLDAPAHMAPAHMTGSTSSGDASMYALLAELRAEMSSLRDQVHAQQSTIEALSEALRVQEAKH